MTPLASDLRLPFLDGLTPQGRSRLHAATRMLTLPPRTEVIRKGDQVGGAYVVLSGALRIYYVSPEGREGTLYWVDAGQSCVLALNCLFARISYPAWVETDDQAAMVAVIAGETYRDLYLSEPELQRFTFAALSTRLFELMTLLEETASQGLEQRVAAFILRRAAGRPTLDITHEQVAHHLGSTREVVSRVLRNLARRGAVSLSPGEIAIASLAILKAQAGEPT